jgi:hypothetical protein
MRIRRVLPLVAFAAYAQTFRDPAPPRVNVLSDEPVPAPVANSDVKFHRKPKALAKGAVTSDWAHFLGPTHNAISPETHLLHKFPSGGPSIVWEMKKGTGYSSPAVSGDRLVFMHRVGNREIVDCLNANTGERYWQRTYATN